MYPFVNLPKPLRTGEFYVLLALAHGPLHAYAIKSAVHKASLGSVSIQDGKLYPLLVRLHDEGLIDKVALEAAGPSEQPRMKYGVSDYGKIRLREEARRLKQAYDILERAGLAELDVDPALQRLLLEVRKI